MTIENIRSQLKKEIVLGYRLFAKLGWGDLGDGHISGRDPEQPDSFWLLDANTPFINAATESLVRVDAQGQVVEGRGETNWPAFYIHSPILQARSDLTSVVHTHTSAGIAFSAEARLFEMISQEACFFNDDHALFDDEEVQVQSLECGSRIADALATNAALILRNHGLLTVGESVRQALVLFVLMDRVADAHLRTNGRAKAISHNAAQFSKVDLTTPSQFNHAFTNLIAHHLQETYP